MNRKEEVLILLQEECGELIQAACKVMRFGENGKNPEGPDITNLEHLQIEIADVLAAVKLLFDEIPLDDKKMMLLAEAKIKKFEKYASNKK